MRSSSAALGAGLHLPPQTGLSGGSGSWIHHSGQLRATVIPHWERNFLTTFKKERCNRGGGGQCREPLGITVMSVRTTMFKKQRLKINPKANKP